MEQPFDDIKWAYVWSLPQKFFLTNKVKEISYKIIHRFYPVKQFLQKFKSDIDISCSFCEFSSETVAHLFWECPFVQSFWNNLNALIVQNIFYDFSLCYKHILFGFYVKDKNLFNASFCINLLLFIGKFYVHKCKYTKCKPHFNIFKQDLKLYLNTISMSVNKKALKTSRICAKFKIFP